MRQYDQFDTDTTPSRVAVERYRAEIDTETDEPSLAVVHYRGGPDELALGVEYAKSTDPLDRITGADILGQLGWDDRTFLDESVKVLISLLDDPEDDVVAAAATALGHRDDVRAIPALIQLADHPNADIRYGVVFGLLRQSHPAAIRAMIALSGDPDQDVRNWATFGLGSQIEVDTPEIREALRANLSDEDDEIRGEAMVGLANRKDPHIIDIILREWQSCDNESVLSLEAAEVAADKRLLEHLERMRAEFSDLDDTYFLHRLEDAITACGGEVHPEGGDTSSD